MAPGVVPVLVPEVPDALEVAPVPVLGTAAPLAPEDDEDPVDVAVSVVPESVSSSKFNLEQ